MITIQFQITIPDIKKLFSRKSSPPVAISASTSVPLMSASAFSSSPQPTVSVSSETTTNNQLSTIPAKAVEKTTMSFIGVLEAIGKDFLKGLGFAVKYAVPVEKLVGLLFPAAAPVATGIADATTLIQNAVMMVEQKYAASGMQNGTGPQKSAEVLTLVGPAVTTLLTQEGVKGVTTDYIQSLISAVVAILNAQPPVPAGQ